MYTILLPSVGNFHHFQIGFTKLSLPGYHHGTTISKNFEKKIIHLFVFLIHLFVIYYSLVCIFLFTCLYSCKALLNLILAPTCKTDYLVLICCFHRKLKFKELSRNTINLHFSNIFLFLWTTVSLLIYTNNYVKDDTHLFVNSVLVLTRKAVLFC